MSQISADQRVDFLKMIKAAFDVVAKLVVILLLLAFLQNFFAVDIRINHAKREVAVQLIVNDLPRVSMTKLLKYAEQIRCLQFSSSI